MSRQLVLVAATLVAGCAPITLSMEVDDLQQSTVAATGAMQRLQAGMSAAQASDRRAAVLALLSAKTPPRYSTACSGVAAIEDGFDAALEAPAYDAAAADAAFRGFHRLELCDLEQVGDPDRPASAAALPILPPATGSIDAATSVGVDTLGLAAVALDDYVAALADLATNATGAERDAARDALFTAGGALLAAAGIPLAAPIAGVLGEIVSSIEAARQNRRIAGYLVAYDAAMPHIMERIGHAGRLAAVQSMTNRASAAARLASSANNAMQAPASSSNDRLLVFEAYDRRIQLENAALRDLRGADPMATARSFAAAHAALTAAYVSPRASRASLIAGLRRFRGAARDLADAIDEEG